jgi:DNA-binding ferritin-like protein
MPAHLEPFQESLDRLAAATVRDEVARATVRDEVWALTQLLWPHAEMYAKVSSLEGQADSAGVRALPSAPSRTLDEVQDAIADRIRRLEHYVRTVQAAEEAEQDAAEQIEQEERRTSLQPLLRDQAVQYGSEALDLLARASVGSLAPDLSAAPLQVDASEAARQSLQSLRQRADDLVERIQALGADAPSDLVAAARHLSTWLKESE